MRDAAGLCRKTEEARGIDRDLHPGGNGESKREAVGHDDLGLAWPRYDRFDTRKDTQRHVATGFRALDAAIMVEPVVIRCRAIARIESRLRPATRNAIADFPEIGGFHHRPLEAPCDGISRLGGTAQVGAMDLHLPAANQSHQPLGRCLRIPHAAGRQVRVVPAPTLPSR